jgi:hypothetical protein
VIAEHSTDNRGGKRSPSYHPVATTPCVNGSAKNRLARFCLRVPTPLVILPTDAYTNLSTPTLGKHYSHTYDSHGRFESLSESFVLSSLMYIDAVHSLPRGRQRVLNSLVSHAEFLSPDALPLDKK